MKAITLQEPWATLVVLGRKPWENRRSQMAAWARRLIAEGDGRVAIHAGAGTSMRPTAPLAPDGLPWPPGNPRHIVGVAVMTGVLEPETDAGTWRVAGGMWRVAGWHGIRLSDARALPRPIPFARGKLGFWRLPDDIAAQLDEECPPCGRQEPDGACEGCDNDHGHTCRACDEEWCQSCWERSAHEEFCPTATREERAG